MRWTLFAAFLVGAVLLGSVQPAVVRAFSRGVSFHGCTGCHGSGTQTVSLTLTPEDLAPGDTGTVRISVRGGGAVVGLYAAFAEGSMTPVSGGGLQRVEGGATHAGPRTVSAGAATFEMRWTAPATAGAVRFDISSVMANGNGSPGGDGGVDSAVFDFVYGCEPATFYRDYDGDGHGRADEPRTMCTGTPAAGYAVAGDDCNDSDGDAYPSAPDACNGRDDDCDTRTDEGSVPVTHYPDGDGDGYYGRAERESGETFFGCGSTSGRWASVEGDCAPTDPMRHPGAEDVCNGYDDDCDFEVDERVRPRCGQGWCTRESFSCSIDDCVEGAPRAETCNWYDDDCDGGVDEDVCPPGQTCGGAGSCVPEGSVTEEDGGAPPMRTDAGTRPPVPPSRSGGCAVGARRSAPLFVLALIVILWGLRARRSAV